jgi:LacI family transcriptional regulator
MKKKQVTLMELALRLNLSPSTVSRALNGRHRISEETRKRVRELADKLEYQPNPAAKSLRENKTYIIGMIIPEIAHGFFSTTISGIEEAANLAGYNIMICQSQESVVRERAVADALLSSRVDGLLFCPSKETTDFTFLNTFLRKDIPVVFFDRFSPVISAPRVVVNDLEGARQAVSYLISTGCRRIAHLAAPELLSNASDRRRGYLRALEEHGIAPDERLIITSNLSEAAGLEAARQLLDLQPLPEAIFCFNDMSAFHVLLEARRRGLRVPEELSVMGFSNEYAGQLCQPTLSTVAQPGYRLGQEAARLMLDLLAKDEDEWPETHETVVLDTELVIRDSTRPLLSAQG